MRVVVQILCASVLVSVATIAAQAQTRAEQQRGIDPEFEQRQRDLKLLDKTMRAREITPVVKRRDPKVVAAEIEEDFTRLQLVNYDLGQAASSPTPLNLAFVVKSAAELADRSKRLGDNLGHVEPDKASKSPKLEPVTNVEQLKAGLAVLDNLIIDFTHNPLFTDANTRDAELLVKARRDLVEIFALSEHLKKNADELSKTVK